MRIVRLNMSNLTLTREDVPEKYRLLGGRALTSQMVADEVDPNCNPIGPFNKLVFAPGLLSGTSAPSSGRLSVGGKSPLTGGIKESNAGGISAQRFANAGVKALVVEGEPADKNKFYVLKIDQNGEFLEEAGDLVGKGTYEVVEILRAKHGEKTAIISVGPAGEMKLTNAGISTCDVEGNSSRYAGRGGLGAVMGAKGLKAIVIDSPSYFNAPVANVEKFRESAKKFAKILQEHPVSGQGLPSFGTDVLMNVLNEAGALPTRNFARGRFEFANNVGGETLAEVATKRGGQATHGCHPGCVMRCSNVYPMPDGKVCSPIEYESAWSLGPHCEIKDLDIVAKLNYICNDVGLDTIEAGGALGVAMEAGIIPWGDGDKAVELLEEVGKGTPLGRIIGNGAAFTGKAFGVAKVAVVKGQHLPAYDPRGAKGIGVTYATTTQGADHTAGYSITANILAVGGTVDPLKAEGQVELSRNLQIATALVDSVGLCLFVAFALLDNPDGLPTMIDMVNQQYDTALDINAALEVGKQVLRVERAFNEKAGFTKAHDRLPEFFKTEKLDPHGTVFDVSDEELDTVFNF
ncbi:MAG TPA: aldehyde ferredoxin oxidoreductase C-terminal domain-containing protein [Verrucomicrobiae bacterium]|nr:aldehyde ferredoxin oxidoreductase C-terminal domain-containing protein [Verrucomicrobiae bacterium]